MTADVCGLCGVTPRGTAIADGVRLCHPDEGQDCYQLWTVHGVRPSVSATTPGPWWYTTYENADDGSAAQGFEAAVWGPDGDAVALVYGNLAADALSNARLIAAAPDLFLALKSVLGLVALLDDVDGFYLDQYPELRYDLAEASRLAEKLSFIQVAP